MRITQIPNIEVIKCVFQRIRALSKCWSEPNLTNIFERWPFLKFPLAGKKSETDFEKIFFLRKENLNAKICFDSRSRVSFDTLNKKRIWPKIPFFETPLRPKGRALIRAFKNTCLLKAYTMNSNPQNFFIARNSLWIPKVWRAKVRLFRREFINFEGLFRDFFKSAKHQNNKYKTKFIAKSWKVILSLYETLSKMLTTQEDISLIEIARANFCSEFSLAQ